jgi:antitoxin YefM
VKGDCQCLRNPMLERLSQIYDSVWHRYHPVIINRRQNEQIIVLRRELQQDILQAYHFKPEILPEEDGAVTATLNDLDIAVNAQNRITELNKLVKDLKLYALDYMDRSQLFLNAPNRKRHFPYVLRITLCTMTVRSDLYWS